MNKYLPLLETGTPQETLLNFDKFIKNISEKGLNFLIRLLFALVIIFVGKKLIKYAIRILEKFFNRSKIEISVSGFLLALVKAILHTILFTQSIIWLFGIDSGTIVAIIGSAGLSISLALQGGLSNFAGGVLILILKPFRVGDYIITTGSVGNMTNEGTVTAIDIFYTKIHTADNKLLVMPNGALSNSNIINASNEATRRLDLTVSIEYREDIQKVKEVLMNILNQNEKVIKDKDINVFVNSLDVNSVSMGIRVWVLNDEYLKLKWELLEQIKNAFDKNQITIPFNQLEITMHK
jgi:small conductance mechanosensitive channel